MPRALLAGGALAILALATRRFAVESLQSIYFLSGWIAGALIVVLAADWWRAASLEGVRRRVRLHGGFSVLLAALFLIHVDFRAPNGWHDLALTTLFVLSLGSLLAGTFLLRRSDAETRHAAIDRWVLAHVAITYGLAALALFHGVYAHGHGLLAHLFLDK